MKKHVFIAGALLVLTWLLEWQRENLHISNKNILWILRFGAALYLALSMHFWKKEVEREIKYREERKGQLKNEIIEISDDLRLEADDTVDDLIFLYDVPELERLVQIIKSKPKGHRRLLVALNELDNAQ
jgi:hypothetical protein